VLVSRAQRGDRDAFSTLIEHYAPTVLSVAWRIVGNRALADDVAQETFLAAFRSLRSFRAESRFSTWLYRIAVNKCRDAQRAQGARLSVFAPHDEEHDVEPMGDSPLHRTPEELLLERHRRDQLAGALRRLTPVYREAFVLKHIEGLDYEEMSSVLGVDGGTLRMRVYKARRELGRELGALVVK
jgi:RNA polymerase sigma-70 factor (ECF subfamily)